MEEDAWGRGPLQDLHPLSKLLITLFYLTVLLSFHPYDLSGILLMAACPILAFCIGNIQVRPMWRRMRVVLIPVLLLGIVNPFFDKTPVLIGSVAVNGGIVSMVTFMIKGFLAVSAVYLLMVTTPMEDICQALRKLHVPALLITVVMLIHRYLIVFLGEVRRLRTAYLLRAPGQKGVHFRQWGSLLGQLLLRSMDRSETVYQSMTLRGFTGESFSGRDRRFTRSDLLFIIIGISVPLLARFL